MKKIKTINRALITLVLTMIFVLGCSYSALTASAASFNKATSYEVVGTNGNDGSYIVSAINVKDYGAVGDGVADDTNAIQEAFFAMSFGGPRKGIIYFPAGKYRVTSPGFIVESGYTIMGQWDDPSISGKVEETIIIADYEEDDGTPLFCVNGASTVCNLSVYYPKQNIDNVIQYADTISTNYQSGRVGDFVTIRNITLYNSYKGINTTGGAQHVANIYGTVLKRGIEVGSNAEVSEFMNVEFSSSFWNGYDGSDEQKIKSYTKENCVAMNIGYIDDILIYNAKFLQNEFLKGVHFYLNHDSKAAGASGVAYGFTYKVNGDISYSDDYAYPNGWPQMNSLDDVPNTNEYNYKEPANRFSTKSDLYNVCAYGAKGNGSSDDTNAFKSALESAGENGGGIVFVPTGNYILSEPLTVPENVEILGEWYGYRTGAPSQINMKLADPDKALFTLSKNSGVQGLTFYLPYNVASDYVVPVGSDYGYANGNTFDHTQDMFPLDKSDFSGHAWLVRANGINCWVENICVTNGWNGFDFASAKCDNFVARAIWGTCMNSGIEIGGGSNNGRISCLFFTFGTWWEFLARAYDISWYSYNNTSGFTFGDCSDIRVLSASTFGLSRAISFVEENGKSPQNISVLRSLMDSPWGHVCLDLQKGNNLSFVGVSSGTNPTADNGGFGRAINVTETFDGKARLYGQNIWAAAQNYMRGDVILYTQESQSSEVISHSFSTPDYTYIPTQKEEQEDNQQNGNKEEQENTQNGCLGSITACGALGLPLIISAVFALSKKSKIKE